MGRFLEGYRRHFGGTDSPSRLYTGFALFFVGAATALFGIFTVLSGDLLVADLAERRKMGIFLASLGLPLIFSGIQLTLPSRRIIHALVGVGALTCIWGVMQFTSAYPTEWNQPNGVDRSSEIIGIYTLGLILLFTTTAMALVVNFVSRHMVLPGHEPDDPFGDPDRQVTIEEVLADIERETSRQNLTWGGMSGDRLRSQVVKLKAEFGPDYVVSGGSGTKTTEFDDDMEDAPFRTLMQMRGRDLKERTATDDTLDAVQALVQMRREQKAEREASWWYRFKRWLVTLFTGGKRGPPPLRASPGQNGAGKGTTAGRPVSRTTRSE